MIDHLIRHAEAIDTCTPQVAEAAVRVIDHTSLKDSATPMQGAETAEEIAALCQQAKGRGGRHVAAVCVYPNQIIYALPALEGTGIQLAVVNNFPHGSASASAAVEEAVRAIHSGAQEIDTVVDYAALLRGDVALVEEKLRAVSRICKQHGVKLKIILKASVYESDDALTHAATLAIACGADFVKTCTGKMPLAGYGRGVADASTLRMAAVVMQAVAKSGRKDVGVKISGGVRTPVEAAQMKYLADSILGEGVFAAPARFRFGASGLLGNLLAFLESAPETAVSQSGY